MQFNQGRIWMNLRIPSLNRRRYRNMNFMDPLLEDEDGDEEKINQPLTLQDHKLSETMWHWGLYFALNLCFIAYAFWISISIVLAYLAFGPSLIMYKWWRKIYRRGGLPEFPDTVCQYTLSFWCAHFVSFVTFIFWILLVFELTLSSKWESTRNEVSEWLKCEYMDSFDPSCPNYWVNSCAFNESMEATNGCSWSSDFGGGCVTYQSTTDIYFPCTTGSDGKEWYDVDSYDEEVDLKTFKSLRSSLELNGFIILLTVGKGIIEQSIKYYFSQNSRKKFPTMLSEAHIDGILYLVTIIGIAFGTAEAIVDIAIDLLADTTLLFLLVSLFFGTLNHGVTSYIIGIGLCKRYILRRTDQTFFEIIWIPILIQWCFDYGKWWLLENSSDNVILQVFFTVMCFNAFCAGYCVLQRQRLNLRDEFLAGGAQIDNSGVQLQVTSYCEEEENNGFQGPEGNQVQEDDMPPPAYEGTGEPSYQPEENPEQQVKRAPSAVDSKEEETALLSQQAKTQAITSSAGSDEEEPLKTDAKSLSEVELLDAPPSSGKPPKRDVLEIKGGGGAGPSQE